jgi:hypothetical protein
VINWGITNISYGIADILTRGIIELLTFSGKNFGLGIKKQVGGLRKYFDTCLIYVISNTDILNKMGAGINSRSK